MCAANNDKSTHADPSIPPPEDKLGVWEKSLEDRANIVSDWLLLYLTPLLKLGASKVIEAKDVGVPSEQDVAVNAFVAASNSWNDEIIKCKAVNEEKKKEYDAKLAKMTEEEREKAPAFVKAEPSIAGALIRSFGLWKVLLATFYYIVGALLSFGPVLILEDLVRYFQYEDHDPITEPWVLVVLLGLLPVVISTLQTRNSVIMAHCATFVRTAVSMLLYKKSLAVSASGRARTSTGQVVNMMSNDTAQLQRFLQFFGMTLVAPIQIVISLVLIYQQVGNATWVGVGFMILLAPVNIVVFSVVSTMRRRVLQFSDLRVKMMNEILAGIRIIKFYAWEKPFGKEVGELREAELQALTRLAYVSAVGFSLILLSAPIIQPILVFLTYIKIQDKPLDASTAFTTVALFNIMRFPFAFMPMGLLQFIQSRISLKRLQVYLQLPELDDYVVKEPHPDDAGNPDAPGFHVGSVTIKNGTFTWIDPDAPALPKKEEPPKRRQSRKQRRESKATLASKRDSVTSASNLSLSSVQSSTDGIQSNPITLQDISCTIKAGSLVAVVGSVGSGKSSLLSAILGEMEPLEESKVYIPRNAEDLELGNFASYCTQSPWVVNDTLRGNILFGRLYDKERYDRVVEVCALSDDLAVLPAGDMTEIGERGINLSGGQKARVSLARAMYSNETKLMLFDDPLSAVDAHVGEHIFKEAIAGEIAQGVTRVLVTHHVHFLPRCDEVIILDHGRITHQGPYADLVAAGVDFTGAVDFSDMKEDESTKDDDNKEETVEKAGEDRSEESKEEGAVSDKKKAELKKEGETLVKEEEREEGEVAGSAYVHYARAGGMWVALAVVIIQGLGRGSEIAGAFWLARWAKKAVDASLSGDSFDDSESQYYLNIYAAFGLAGVFGLTVRSLLMSLHRLRASRKMHEDLTSSVLRAPVAFFDVTPTGRILNRFAADMDKVDLELTQSLGQGVSTVFSVLGAIGAIIAATRGTFLVPLVPLGYIYFLIQKWFRKTSTEMQRVNSVANSPIFADFSQILSGTSTIRAYGEQDRFFTQCQNSFDNMNASYMLVQLVGYWLGLRLDILGGAIAAFIGGIAVATSDSDFIQAGWLGLALAYSIEVTGFLKHGVRMIATVEAQMNSVERVLYYSENIDSEAPARVPDKDPAAGAWPTKGEIEISHANLRYRDGPLVLKDLSITVRGGEKIGVVGRTGSGKSSLMVALFRISELDPDGGCIEIDGVKTQHIGTETLRLNISIIPQDPVMFSNTVRYNLDPFRSSSDDELWSVLQKVQLNEVIATLPGGLDEQVAEGGENFSQGQRQLLCIARSLLRKPKILFMDEATASIDNTTDAAIQKMIREEFRDATVLVIAHRLGTILDSDRILVLDGGRVAEFDTPQALLSKTDGIFKSMVDKSRATHDDVIE